MKLWDKGGQTAQQVEAFTVGRDRELDVCLAPYDVIGTLAHIEMLTEVGLLEQQEFQVLKEALLKIYEDISAGQFQIEEGVEDVHSQIEFMLTRELGDIGKKVHSGRSRNDQVLVDIKLWMRAEIKELVSAIRELFDPLIQQSERHKDTLLPGYTHMQIAMPSSFGLWFGAYAESLAEDLLLFVAAYRLADQNPLGSAAGYGSSFPLDRSMTTRLLGFREMSYNVVNAQMGRGKVERALGFAMANLAGTLNKLSADVCLYMSQNMGFLSLPEELTTGSSIMPHKKNPDVFEVMRAKTNRLQHLPAELSMILTNLPSGYHRDVQLTKEVLLPAVEELKGMLAMARFGVEHIQVKEGILEDPMYNYLFSVEAVNALVLEGMSFRDAYKRVAADIGAGAFIPVRQVFHMHEGSMGNLCLGEIRRKFEANVEGFDFGRAEEAVEGLLGWER